jgi:hypothetical protein
LLAVRAVGRPHHGEALPRRLVIGAISAHPPGSLSVGLARSLPGNHFHSPAGGYPARPKVLTMAPMCESSLERSMRVARTPDCLQGDSWSPARAHPGRLSLCFCRPGWGTDGRRPRPFSRSPTDRGRCHRKPECATCHIVDCACRTQAGGLKVSQLPRPTGRSALGTLCEQDRATITLHGPVPGSLARPDMAAPMAGPVTRAF